MCVNLCKWIYLMMNEIHTVCILVSELSKAISECMSMDADMYTCSTQTLT